MNPPTSEAGTLARRFARHAASLGLVEGEEPHLVAVSGGLDSVVLLHLLRFATSIPAERLLVAHFDHGLRPGSPGDARWVRGLARAWGLEVELARADSPPASEEEARDLRYAFLERVAATRGATAIVTAHQADDQAETVLFRVLRGTGLRGLRGMAPRSGLRVRPLLPFWRAELEGYARLAHLGHRPDSTNRDPAFARNVLRHEILPRAEQAVAPGARRALLRLARNAIRAEAAWSEAESELLEGVVHERSGGGIVLARPAFLAYHPAVRRRLLRACARDLGVDLSEAGTRVAMEFTSRGGSGREIRLSGALHFRRDFDALVLQRRAPDGNPVASEQPLLLRDPDPGEGEACLGGRTYRVRWGFEPERLPAGAAGFAPGAMCFPLRIRAPRPGDRMRLAYGTKKVAKLLGEARVPRRERRSTAVLTDDEDRVLWVPGVARSVDAVPTPGQREFYIGVEDAHSA